MTDTEGPINPQAEFMVEVDDSTQKTTAFLVNESGATPEPLAVSPAEDSITKSRFRWLVESATQFHFKSGQYLKTHEGEVEGELMLELDGAYIVTRLEQRGNKTYLIVTPE